MNEDTFWSLVEAAKAACTPSLSNQPELLRAALEKLPPEEILDFKQIFMRLRRAAYRRDLWAAAFIIEGGCSNDGFMDFRSGLIGLGRDAYYGALADPQSLASQPTAGVDFSQEELAYAANDAYQTRTGRELETHFEELPELTGEEWDEASVYAKYPVLTLHFCGSEFAAEHAIAVDTNSASAGPSLRSEPPSDAGS